MKSGAWCSNYNDSSQAAIFGHLYNWYAISDSRNIAPEGWHVPTVEEFKELEMYLGMGQSEVNKRGWHGTNEGSKLVGNAELWNECRHKLIHYLKTNCLFFFCPLVIFVINFKYQYRINYQK